jgi:PAS domain S-box-containing protein
MNLTSNQGLLAASAVLLLAPLAALGWMGRLRVLKGLASVSLSSWWLLALISPIAAILAGSAWLLLRKHRQRLDSEHRPVAASGRVVSTQATELAREPRQSDAPSRPLVEEAPDYGICMLDPDGRVATWNVGAERIKGYHFHEIIGRHFSCFYLPEAVESGFPGKELQIAAEQGRFEDEAWRIRKDGTMFWANVIIAALRDESGKLMGYSKITRDLTERKRATTRWPRTTKPSSAATAIANNSPLPPRRN